ncbi:MAG TPA: HEAT repeat domain-containing protein, partial [Woeseiaceae bacterium]|nr:HEAT repeat domain-containing protein [Woeseiaceae bacterium]
MTRVPAIFLGALILMTTSTAFAQADESEELKIAALEALMSAPPERALPIVRKVLAGSGSAELKERALFVLGQIDLPEAQSVLVDTAQNGSGALRLEAIRTIGIGGNPQALAGLADIYAAGDSETRDAVLEAWLIADDRDAVYRVAANTQDPEEFENAVETL